MVTPARPKRIAIADDSSAFLSAASTYVASLPGCELAGTAPNASAALALVEKVAPDVLLLDLGAVPSRGLEMVRRVKAASRPPTVIALALFHTQEGAAQARLAGAEALVGKDAFVSGLNEVLVRLVKSR
ncbi:MAG TPA: response regulator [Burkholderiales bacterium]|nr:response regulator [Burkholderiales bacterium]